MRRWEPSLSEPDRHVIVATLIPEQTSLSAYLEVFADPSWRVRRAALRHVEHFANDPDFIGALIEALSNQDNAGQRNAASDALVRVGERAVEPLSSALSLVEVDARKFIVEALGLIGGDAAERTLYRCLLDLDLNVRAAAAEGLGRIGGITTAEHLMRMLEDERSDIQTAAYLLDALASMKARVALGRVQQFWDRPALRRSLYAVLGYTRDVDAIGLLVDGLSSGSRGNRRAALLALAHLMKATNGHQRVAQLLSDDESARQTPLDGLQDESDEVLTASIEILATLRSVELAARILDASACRTTVETAMNAIVPLGSEVATSLLDVIHRFGIESRVLFLEAIEFLGSTENAEALVDVASHSDVRTAEAAIRAAGRIGDCQVVPRLMELVGRAPGELETQIAYAIADIGGRDPDATADLIADAVDSGESRAAWLIALGAIGRSQDIPRIMDALNDRETSIREAAYGAANLYAGRIPLDGLVFGLTDESAAVRACAARALGHYREQEALDGLLAAVKDNDGSVVADAVRSLGAFGGPRVLATIRAAANSSDSVVAIAGLDSLFRLNPKELAKCLEPAFSHADPEVVSEAIRVTSRLDDRTAAPFLLESLTHRSWIVRRAAAETLIARPQIPIDEHTILAHLAREAEPMVRESLVRLTGESSQ